MDFKYAKISAMDNLKDALNFIKLTQNFQKIKRVILVNGTDERENDSEHSFQLALLAWYLIDSQKLDMDVNKAIKYSLVHDLVEVYAGDTYIYTQDANLKSSKPEREREAADRLRKEFPKFKDLHETIQEYEKKETLESKFVYALDKVIPVLNVYLDDGRTWKKMEITLDMIIKNKADKVALSPEVKKYFDSIIEILKLKQQELF